MNELALFAGAGGGILGAELCGRRTVCAVEIDPYARSVLLARQNDGTLPPFPVWDDITSFDGHFWRGRVDVVSGGFPCQDISAAGRGAGITGERSGLWAEMARVIREVQPRFVLVENSPMLTGRGLDRVLGDLAALGFDARWGVLGAADVGAPHKRDRIWIVGNACGVANTNSLPWEQGPQDHATQGPGRRDADRGRQQQDMANTSSQRLPQPQREAISGTGGGQKGRAVTECGRWPAEPDVGRVAHGVAHRVDRLKALGNGQVPRVVATAWCEMAPQSDTPGRTGR